MNLSYHSEYKMLMIKDQIEDKYGVHEFKKVWYNIEEKDLYEHILIALEFHKQAKKDYANFKTS